ncbi:bacteriophage tail protein [Gluconobacter morbifer G707]|uniref:Bacteriophage tail protein n=2 Tax=Gluconobacter TaxID=441 RepID=G6XIR2_9PROT|nr:bacteriophage tail protein [Gluconobacter morbifer G707]
METFQRLAEADADLLTEIFPSTTRELLPEWEKSTGLPDPCAGESPSFTQRRAQVVARLTDNGGCSKSYFIAFASALGFDITITEYAPARAGLFRAGEPAYGESWAFAWTVSAPGYTPIYFRAGSSAAGEALASWGNAVLECEIKERAPAHTVPLFAQNGENLITDFGPDIV